jgi:hypothetical protein
LLSLALAVCSRSPRAATSPARVCAVDCEPAQLALGILADFRDDVRQHGAEFCVLHVPARSDLGRRLAGRPLEYAALLEAICRRHPVVDPQPALLAAAEQSSLEEIAPRHYTPRGNRILALELGDFLVEEIQE